VLFFKTDFRSIIVIIAAGKHGRLIILRFIVNWILRAGIVELFTIFFISVNILAFTFCIISKNQTTNIKQRISEAVLILLTLACGGIGAFLGMCITKHRIKERASRLIVAAGMVIALIPIIHITHGFTLDRTIRYVEIEFHSQKWPSELDGYRIAFITDTHIISDETMRNVAAELNTRNIDLLLLGGDFSTRNDHYQGTVREIAQISTTDGIFGVEGNHDNYIALFNAKRQHGITPLDNSGTHIRSGFFLAGVQDKWNRSPNISKAIAGAYPDDFILLVTHNPDVTMVQPTYGLDLILAGHTHSGQITFFGFAMYLLRGSITNYGTRFAYGFAYSADGVPVFTSSGIGVYYTIPRILARPEVVIINIRSY